MNSVSFYAEEQKGNGNGRNRCPGLVSPVQLLMCYLLLQLAICGGAAFDFGVSLIIHLHADATIVM